MEVKNNLRILAIICVVWISLAIICAPLGNINYPVFIGLSFFFASMFTVTVVFGLWTEKKKPEIELLNEIKNIKSKLDELTKEVEEIKKAIEE